MASSRGFDLRLMGCSVRRAWRKLGHALGLSGPAGRSRPLHRFALLQRLEDRNLLSATPIGAELRVNTTNAQQTFFQAPQAVAVAASGDFVVTPTAGLVSTEAGGTATFTVALTRQPTAPVTLGIASSVPAEGTVSTSSLTFTPANWNVPQTVTVTGVNDFVDDGDQVYQILTGPAQSADASYNGLDGADVTVTNLDDDTAGITVRPGYLVGPEFRVNTTTANAQQTSFETPRAVATDGLGNFAVVWSSQYQDGSGWGVYGQRYNAAGAPQGGEFQINTTTAGDQRYAAVAAANNGQFVVTWSSQNQDGSGWGIYAQRYAKDGTPQGGEFRVNTTTGGNQQVSSVAVQNNGDFVIAWSDDNNGVSWGVRAQRYAKDGTRRGGEVQVNATIVRDQRDASVAAENNGDFVVTWSSQGQDGSGWGIYARRFDKNGLPRGREFRVNSTTAGDQRFATVGIAKSGDFVVTWSSQGQDGSGWGVYAQRYDRNGNPLGGEFQVNTTTAGDQQDASVAMDDFGNFVITWSSQNGSGWDVYARSYNAAGVPQGSEFLVNSTTPGDQQYASAAIDPSGNLVVVWSSLNQDGSAWGVYGQRFLPSAIVLTTTEAGGTFTFTVILNSQPTADVTLALGSSDTTEGVPSASSLVFTASNWNVPQTVTVTGVDDFVVDGAITYKVLIGPATSIDPGYQGLDPPDLTAVNLDDGRDTPGITVTPTSGLVITEAGGTATFTVMLNSQPTADVTIGLRSSNPSEGAVSASSLTFTAANWDVPQTVTVTGVDDFVDDGDQAYTVITAPAVSADPTYGGLVVANVAVINRDDDTAGILVTPTSGLVTTEAGGTASFTVTLTSQPTANVTIGISSSNRAEGTVSTSSLTFTAANWNIPQVVTVTGVDDFLDDGDVAYTIRTAAAVSNDPKYRGLDPADVAVVNRNDDTAGIVVSPTSGLVTTEAGGTATFTVVLSSQPTANVTVGLSVSDPSEGTVSASRLTFTAANWNVAQTITVTGVDDLQVDGNVAHTIVTAAAISADVKYSGLDPADVAVTNTDNDRIGITVAPTPGLVTSEAGGTATFTVVLTSQPTANVIVGISSSDTSEGTVSVSSLTFTPANWNVAQTVRVIGVDDLVVDGDVAYTIITAAAVSADANYNGLNPADVTLTNTDNETPGITVSPVSGLITTEAGGTAAFTVVMNTLPLAPITISIASSNPAEGTVSVSSLTFTLLDWNVPQTVTITGVNDFVADGDAAYTIVTGAAVTLDPVYSGWDPPDVSVTNVNTNTAGIRVTAASGLVTTEAGGTASFSVVLNSKPTADVTISFSGDTTEGSLSTPSLTFTAADWNVPQTVTVTGVDDPVADGDVAYAIVTAPAVSTDAKYGGLNAADVGVTNRDDDTAGILVTPVSGLVTTEAGGTASFTVALTSRPTASVTIDLSSSNAAEGTLSTTSLTFTPADWNVAQTVTVTGVDDFLADGDVAYTLVTRPAVSLDPLYNGRDAADVAVTNLNDDRAGILVNPVSGLVTTEAGATATFTIVLTSQPTADVTVRLTSSNPAEGTLSTSSLTFTAANWNVAQAVTVTGVDDLVADGNVAYAIVTAPAVSADPNYNGRDAADVGVINLDDDRAGILVRPTAGLTTTEAGGTATFTVVLTSRPTADVTINLRSSDPTEGTVSSSSLTFTPADWNVARTITVTGVDDLVDDGDVGYRIIVAPASSLDARYNGLPAPAVSITNTNDDTAGIRVGPTSGLETTASGGTAAFTVVLTSQPTANVTIDLASSNQAVGALSTSRLTFTPADWNVARTVTVTGLNDPGATGDVNYTVQVGPAQSSDPGYSGQRGSDVRVTHKAEPPSSTPSTPPPVSGGEKVGDGPVAPPSPPPPRPTPNEVILVGGTADPASPTTSIVTLTETPNAAAPVAGPSLVASADLGVPRGIHLGGTVPIGTARFEAAPESRRTAPVALEPARVTALPESASAAVVSGSLPPTSEVPVTSSSLWLPANTPVTSLPQQRGQAPDLLPELVWSPQDEAVDLPGVHGVSPQATAWLGTGVLASAGYVLLNTRTGFWLLSLLTAKPLWKQFDPLEILYAWEEENKDREEEDEETLASLVK